ncbi:MAG TPA: metal-dependent hydrolase [Methanoregula sp.]|nr:metal-dependent hydrolase [Methanoregula sp.]
MFVFAHAFLGALIGLGFWQLTHDKRAFPFCILCAILPDLLDKPLAFIFPQLFGSGRTLGHAFLIIALAVFLACLFWYYRHSLLGIAGACALLSHAVLDEMWGIPSTWYFPFMGPFGREMRPDYLLYSLWREVSTLSEWVFAFSLVILIPALYPELTRYAPFSRKTIHAARYPAYALLVVAGIALILPSTGLVAPTVFAPSYAPSTGFMAGVLALGGLFCIHTLYQRGLFTLQHRALDKNRP